MSAEAELLVTKIEAARRQLDCAIRMVFADEDELAVQTLASAAHRILSDLLSKRGKDDLHELLEAGLLAIAADVAEGHVGEDDLQSQGFTSEILKALGRLASDIRDGEDAEVHVRETNPKHRKYRENAAANFLKHADIDDNGFLSTGNLDYESKIMRAVSSYITLGFRPTVEMEIYTYYILSLADNPPHFRSELTKVHVEQMKELSIDLRRRFCALYISRLKREISAPPDNE